MRAVLSLWLLLTGAACAQTGTERYAGLLDRVRYRMRQAMARIPNHTCTENLVRETLAGSPLQVQCIDRARLEVAVVDEREMFSWPGAETFEETDPGDLVAGGSMTIGEFAGNVHTVFDSDAVLYGKGESEDLAGRRAVRFDYRLMQPRYTLRCGDKRKEQDVHVPFHGSFWVDEAGEKVLALEMLIDDVPRKSCISTVRILIEFGMVRLGNEEFPLPAAADIAARYARAAREDRNRIRFSGCRRYTGESTIRFGEDAPAPQSPRDGPPPAQRLPGGLKLDVLLEKEIGIGAAAGDSISAVVMDPVRAGSMEIPKGARLTGRVIRFQSFLVAKPYSLAEVEFTKLEFQGRRLDFHGRLLSFQRDKDLRLDGAGVGSSRDLRAKARFLLKGWPSPPLPAGFRMTWETAGR